MKKLATYSTPWVWSSKRHTFMLAANITNQFPTQKTHHGPQFIIEWVLKWVKKGAEKINMKQQWPEDEHCGYRLLYENIFKKFSLNPYEYILFSRKEKVRYIFRGLVDRVSVLIPHRPDRLFCLPAVKDNFQWSHGTMERNWLWNWWSKAKRTT